MSYKITHKSLSPNPDTREPSTLEIAIENRKMRFPQLTYRFISVLKKCALVFSCLIALVNRLVLWDRYHTDLSFHTDAAGQHLFREKDSTKHLSTTPSVSEGVFNLDYLMPLLYMSLIA